ncbi:MAG: winged helix-turn-helix transcriptional regulator [Candidatus Aenigmarchaeota archaeon]|nr:winged helix-turn-helix transcriptional regulator [Candidatus Aenigmarchaeota archaeon]
MAQNITKNEKDFIDRIGKISKQWGLGEPTGRVWATLLFADSNLSQKDIAKKTGYSLSLVSPSLKILEKLNMIRSVRGKGREKLYELAMSFIEAFNAIIKRFLECDVKPLINGLEQIKGINKNPKLLKLKNEYKQMERYFNWFGKMIVMKKITGEKINKLLG